MVEEWMRISKHPENGFYLYDFEKLQEILLKLENKKQKTLLIGVSFALLDFAEKYSMQLSHTIVMETGGMKGRRKEITREELHQILKMKLGVTRIHSEYGMTELLSQAYSMGEGRYQPVPWMKMLLRDEDDPLTLRPSGEGLLNIIDLANRYSCSFISTDDVVKISEDGSFEILGRMDNSDIRGCSLLGSLRISNIHQMGTRNPAFLLTALRSEFDQTNCIEPVFRFYFQWFFFDDGVIKIIVVTSIVSSQ